MTPEQFNQAMAALPEPPSDSYPPLWDYWRHNLWELGKSQDPRRFETWPCIYHTMLVNHWFTYIELQRQHVKSNVRLMAETFLPPYPMDRFGKSPYSANLIHQAHHLWTYFEYTGVPMRPGGTVIEFGGGYGAMALLFRRLCMADDYNIIDLPEFALLQQFYLSQMGADERVKWNDAPDQCDLFLSCYGLSETPSGNRNAILDAHRAKRYLFLYTDQFDSEDNVRYFQHELPAHIPELRFEHISCDDVLPPGSWYTIGW